MEWYENGKWPLLDEHENASVFTLRITSDQNGKFHDFVSVLFLDCSRREVQEQENKHEKDGDGKYEIDRDSTREKEKVITLHIVRNGFFVGME